MATPVAIVTPTLAESNLPSKMAFWATVAFVYVYVSRVLDVSIPSAHMPLLLGILAAVALLGAQRLHAGFKTHAGFWYLLLTCWFAAGVPFAVWRSGALDGFQGWLRSLLVWALIMGSTITYRQSKIMLNALAFAAFTTALIALRLGTASADERLYVPDTTLANANTIALVLVVGAPFLWRLFATGGFLRQLAIAGMGVPLGLCLMKTGSRGGLFSLALALGLIMLYASLVRKIQIGVAALVLAGVALVVLPPELRHRYLTFTSAHDVTTLDEAMAATNAIGSAENRWQLVVEGVWLTRQHPLFGVGMNDFAVAIYGINQEQGRAKEAWHGTHNTYVQLSSEAGIPALICFIAILVISWRSLRAVIRATRGDPRPEVKDIRASAVAMQACLGSFALFLFFAHIAYECLPHILTAIALVTARTGTAELKRLGVQVGKPIGASNLTYAWSPRAAQPSAAAGLQTMGAGVAQPGHLRRSALIEVVGAPQLQGQQAP
jgi:O-antigen ligase